MSMTRKDFELLAGVLKDTKPELDRTENRDKALRTLGAYDRWAKVVAEMGSVLILTNTNFDEYRFLTACGLPPAETSRAGGGSLSRGGVSRAGGGV